MIDDIRDIAEYYNSDPEREHHRLERHQLEMDITWRFFDQYLPPRGSILEVGAATGRYTLELAKRGYTVTAVDISAGLLDQCRQRVLAAGLEQQVRFAAADARELSAVPEKEYDAVLLMGPLYHLIIEADRKLALKEAYDRLRPGGLIFSAFISRYGVMGDLMRKIPDWIDNQADVQAMLEKGHRPDDAPPGEFRAYFASLSEIAPLHEAAGFETVAVAGVEPAISSDDESYNILEGERRRLWQDLLFKISTEPSMVASSRHILYIGKKRGSD